MTGYARQEEIVDREYGGGAVSNKQAESFWDYPRLPRVEAFAGLVGEEGDMIISCIS